MKCVIYCIDKPDSAELRMSTLQVHRDYLQSQLDKIVWASAIVDDRNESMSGSLFIVNVADRQAAEDFSANDPFTKAGVFERVEIWRVRRGIFRPELATEEE